MAGWLRENASVELVFACSSFSVKIVIEHSGSGWTKALGGDHKGGGELGTMSSVFLTKVDGSSLLKAWASS